MFDKQVSQFAFYRMAEANASGDKPAKGKKGKKDKKAEEKPAVPPVPYLQLVSN